MVRRILGSIFWIVVIIGLMISSHPTMFWKLVLIVWLFVNVVSLYGYVKGYSIIENKKQQEKYKKNVDEFNRLINDWTKGNYKQPIPNKPEMNIVDAYKLLNLKYTDTPAVIKKRYRNLAMQWHPDKFATDTKDKQEIASRNFQKLNKAYNIIKKHKNIL